MERQGISRRKAQVKQLQQNHTLVTETADKAKSINELLPLLAYIAQVRPFFLGAPTFSTSSYLTPQFYSLTCFDL